MNIIKPCPFCGSSSISSNCNPGPRNTIYFYVSCDVCGCRTRGLPIKAKWPDDGDVDWNNVAMNKSIASWNLRAERRES